METIAFPYGRGWGRIQNSPQSFRTEIHDCHASEHKHLVREVRGAPPHYQDEFSK